MFRFSKSMGTMRWLACLAFVAWPVATLATQRPMPGELERYKKDGTLAERIQKVTAIGNHEVDPALAWKVKQRLMKEAGKTDAEIAQAMTLAPPPDRQGGLPAFGTPKAVVILIDFSDYPHDTIQTTTDVNDKFFVDGNLADAPYESLRNFYQRSSYNQLTIQGNVLGWYRAAYVRSHYTGDAGREELIMEAFNYYNPTHNFAQYDNDGNGTIDAFYIKWTGPDTGWGSMWWAYRTDWYVNPGFRVDGKSLFKYVWSWISNPEHLAYNVHVDIHETGHLLGLPDLYDYDDGVGPKGGVGGLDMMDSNWGDHNCFSKYMLEWLNPTVVNSGALFKSLNPSGTSTNCVMIMPGITSSTMFDEFFMVQYRQRNTGNDPNNYPTDGYLIWHIDSTLNGTGQSLLYNNSNTAHKYIRLMEADGLEEIESNKAADAGDFYVTPDTFGPSTTPNSHDYSGADTGVMVNELGAADTTMSGRFSINCPYPAAPATPEPDNGSIDAATSVTLSWDNPTLAAMADSNPPKQGNGELPVGTIDVNTSEPIKPNPAAQLENGEENMISPATSRLVLWDLGHGVYLNYQPSGSYSNLASDLAARGYTIETTMSALDTINLRGYAVLVISTGSAWYTAYTSAEITAIQSYVSSGGGLLVMGGHMSTPNYAGLVAQAFGVTTAMSDFAYDLTFSSFASHPLFTGCTSIYYRAGGRVGAASPASLVAWSSGLGTVAVSSRGQGRVVVTGDNTFCSNYYLSTASNQTFARNIFDWLSTGCPRTYDVYLGATPDSMVNIATGLTIPQYSPGPLACSTTYYWRVDVTNCCGTTEGPTWQFTTRTCCEAPPTPNEPTPLNGATHVPATTNLSWNSGVSTLLLDANFNSKAVDTAIGTGGAAAGEPVYVNLNAIVRNTPMPTRCLELTDTSSVFAQVALFEFLDSAEIQQGIVTIDAELWFEVYDSYMIYICEQGGATSHFCDLRFSTEGKVVYYDGNTTNVFLTTYVTGRTIPVRWVFDMTHGTCSVWFDGLSVVQNNPHGITGHGLGSIMFGLEFDSDLNGRYNVDSLHVTWTGPGSGAEAAPLNPIAAAIASINARAGTEGWVKEGVGSDGVPIKAGPTGPAAATAFASTESAGGLNIALVAAASLYVTDSRFTDPQAKLLATGQFASVSVINASAVTPDVSELAAFDAVLVWSNYNFLDATALGNNLADYVDAGGGVVLALFADTDTLTSRYPQGRFLTDNYYCITPAGGDTRDIQATLGTVFQPAHPTMQDIVTFDGGLNSFRPTNTSLVTGSTLIANWSDGKPLVVVRDIGGTHRVDLGMYPPSDAVSSGFWVSTTDGAKLMANALVYTSTKDCYGFGLADQTWGGANRLRGNVYTFASNQTLTQINIDLNFTGTSDLYYYVLEADAVDGTYTPVFEKIVPTFGVGRGTYSSGPIQVLVGPGKYYGIGTAWTTSSITYYRDALTLPQNWDLGTVQKFLYLDTAPPYSAPITPYTGADSRQGEYVVNLCFGRGPCATTYDVYLDTVNPPTTRIAQGITGTICDPTPTAGSTLLYDTQYYWRVIAGTAGGSATGPVWSFRTITAPPFITGAVSRKTHGASTRDIPLPTSGKCGVECRKNGPALVIVTFDKTIQGRFGLDTSDVVLNSSRIPVGTITGVSISGGTTLTITMTGTADAACLIIGFPGIEGADESPVTQTLPLGVLYGDTTYDGRTNVLDLMAIKPQINIPVSAANFRCDINCDNAINVLDLLATKNNLNKAIGKCP